MQRNRLKRLTYQHTVMGAVFGWLLYLVNFSGSVAMFVDEIRVWEEPAARRTINSSVPMQTVIDAFISDLRAPLDFIEVTLPSPGSSYYELRARYGTGDDLKNETRRYAIDTGVPVSGRGGEGVALWLQQLHRYLAIEPKIIGRTLVGLTGVYMLVLILSGIVTHQKIARDLFKIRWTRSLHVKWRDLHNATGLWTLPFAIVIAFSGIMVGTPPLMAVVAGLPMTGGDISRLEAMLGRSEEPSRSGVNLSMVSADHAMKEVAAATDFVPAGVRIQRYGDRNAAYWVLADSPREMLYLSNVPVNAATGAVEMERYAPLTEGIPESVAGRVFAASTPLHYGLFGPLALNVLYYLLGMAVSVCIAVGMLIYFERRLGGSTGHFSQRTYKRLSLVNAGLVAGLPMVTLLMFYLDRILMSAGESRYVVLAISFVALWFSCVIYALICRIARVVARRLMGLTLLLAIFLPAFDYLTLGRGVANEAVLLIHGLAVFSGLCLLVYLAVTRAVFTAKGTEPMLG
ncbi:MAG: PepSY-associated TM helix domain-containing protein [Pseudomonadota bacterium]